MSNVGEENSIIMDEIKSGDSTPLGDPTEWVLVNPKENVNSEQHIQSKNDLIEQEKVEVSSEKSFHSSDSQIVKLVNKPLQKVPSPIIESEEDIEKKSKEELKIEKRIATATSTEETSLKSANRSKEPPPYTAFSKKQRLMVFLVIIYVGFLGPLSGNIYIPALPLLQESFNVSATTINATVSVFMAVFSVGPLFWALFADFGGRKFLYIVSLLLTIIVNILLSAVPTNIGALFFLRIAQAFGSSSVMSLGIGTVSDITPPKSRGRAVSYFMLGPNMGPILAPIIAGLILMSSNNWRWLFGFICIISGIALFLVVLLLPETLRCIVGNGDPRWREDYQLDAESQALKADNRLQLCKFIGIQVPVSESLEFQKLYPRPPKPRIMTYWSLIKFLPVTICSVCTALLFATYYAFSVTLSHFLKEQYNLSSFQVGAAYVCPGVALLLGSLTGGHLSDYFRKRWLKKNEDQKFSPARRLKLQVWGLLISMCGCIGYGWSIERHYHLVVVLVFSFLIAFGMTWCSNATMTYLTETIPKRAAGTVAVSSFFRNIAAAISAVIIMKLCERMGIGWCFTGLGLCDLISMAGILYLIKHDSPWNEVP